MDDEVEEFRFWTKGKTHGCCREADEGVLYIYPSGIIDLNVDYSCGGGDSIDDIPSALELLRDLTPYFTEGDIIAASGRLEELKSNGNV